MRSYSFLLVALVATTSACTASAETIEQAITHAVQNHPSIRASQAAADAAYQTIIEEKSAYYPTVSADASFGRVYSNNTTTRGLSVSRGIGYGWVGEGSGNISQTLYNWGATKNGVQSAAYRYDSANALSKSQGLSIALQAAQSYLQLLRARMLLDKATVNDAQMADYYTRIEAAFNNGGADESQLSRAQDLVSLAKNSILQYESDLQIAQANYKESVGRLPKSDVADPSIATAVLPKTIEEAAQLALMINPQVQSLEADIMALASDADRESVNTLPVLNAELSALKRDQKDLIGGEAEDVRGLVTANWNYSIGGAQAAAQDRAVFQREQARHDYEALKRLIERDVEVAWVSYNLARARKNNEIERLEAAEKTLETYQEQYEGGQQTLLDVMSVINTRFFAEQDYLNIFYEEMSAVYNLKSVIGLPLAENKVANNDEG